MNRSIQKLAVGIAIGAFLIALAAPRAAAQFPPAPGTGPGLAETIEAIDSARVTTRILYITAHPDDESATLLTYLARGLHADVALLTLTRGEGGQNALGPEQAPQLGLIRTQELLAATRGYGIKLFFTGAKDFGYSKTPEETMKVWGDPVLGDMVRVIRTFRPTIVINGWGGVHGGHGHHQTSGLWTPHAVALAADPKAFPEQFNEGLQPWGGTANSVQILDTERGGSANASTNRYTLPVDDLSPLWGKTWREIGLDAFVNHRSQGIAGFLGSPFLRRPLVLIREDGGTFDPASLARALQVLDVGGPAEATFRRVADEAESAIIKAHAAALAFHWDEAARNLASAAQRIESLFSGAEGARWSPPLYFELEATRQRIERALSLVAGVQVRAEADRDALVARESFAVTVRARCREDAECKLGQPHLVLPQGMSEKTTNKEGAKSGEFKVLVEGPAPVLTAWDKLLPEPPALVLAKQEVTIAGYKFHVTVPVAHIAASSTRVDRVPLRIAPAYTLAVEPKQEIEVLAKQRKPFDVLLRVHSYATQPGKVSVGLDVPQGWTSSAQVSLEFSGTGDQYAKLTVTPPEKLAAGNYTITAYAKRGEDKFSVSLEPLTSMPTQFWEEPAQCVVHAFDINVPENLRVGYITAESEPIPEALQRLGIHVETLDAQALAFSDLSKFDAIVVGVRAYELRPELPGANQRLLDYASNGGALVVQYNRDFIWDKLQPAPYPAKIDPGKPGSPLPRITDETAAVKFLQPDDALLNRPNKITPADFDGWVQERGLYFWSQFDPRYTALLAMHDPGEPDLSGGLVYARTGKGIYIYTGLSFIRQLPEGVPGAYRLFVNLLSAGRAR